MPNFTGQETFHHGQSQIQGGGLASSNAIGTDVDFSYLGSGTLTNPLHGGGDALVGEGVTNAHGYGGSQDTRTHNGFISSNDYLDSSSGLGLNHLQTHRHLTHLHHHEPHTFYNKNDSKSGIIGRDLPLSGITAAVSASASTNPTRLNNYSSMIPPSSAYSSRLGTSYDYNLQAGGAGLGGVGVKGLSNTSAYTSNNWAQSSSSAAPFQHNLHNHLQSNTFLDYPLQNNPKNYDSYYRDDFNSLLESSKYSAYDTEPSSSLFRPKSAPLLTATELYESYHAPSSRFGMPSTGVVGHSSNSARAAATALNYGTHSSGYNSNTGVYNMNRNAHHNYPSSVGGPNNWNSGPSNQAAGGGGNFSQQQQRNTNSTGMKKEQQGPTDFGGIFPNFTGGNGATMGGVAGTDEIRQQSLSSESQAYYGNERMVNELMPEFVRWFYRYEQDRKWQLFTGYDSIRIENRYRELFQGAFPTSQFQGAGSRYPLAASNDESTDVSRLARQFNQQTSIVHNNNNINNKISDTRMWGDHGGMAAQQNWYSGGGVGSVPGYLGGNSSAGSYLGRGGGGYSHGPFGKEGLFQRVNSASALLGGPGSINGMTSVSSSGSHVIVVREGLYEVDLNNWTCSSTYWPGDTSVITRGMWFFDGTWDPLPLEQAEKLEEAHLSKFYGSPLNNSLHHNGQQFQQHSEDPSKAATNTNATPVHRLPFNDFHVDWTSPTDVFWYSAAPSHKLMRSVGQKLGFSDFGQRICRGYYKPALLTDKPSEIGHIVFVIHGIGQKMDTGRIVRNCSAFRDCVSSMKEKYFPQLNNAKQRAEFFPVEWRSAAKLDGDVVEAITPQKLLSLRQLLNSTAMDIMYYTSPLYRAEIQNALIDELNRIYANFVNRNPNFVLNGGKVSVLAHSLGAVITYDIITGYLSSSVMDDHMPSLLQFSQIPTHMPRQQGLLFKMEHFFCLGSPLSVFLALRWREPHDPTIRSQILPSHLCRRIYNVFYSSDPVAYRLEPLLNRQYVKVAPVTIHCYNAPVKPRYCDMPRERITVVASKTATDNTSSSMPGQPNSEENTSNIPTSIPLPSLKAPLPSIPSLPKPSLPSLMKMPQTQNKGGNASDQQQAGSSLGGWLGNLGKKIWNGSAGAALDLADQAVGGQFPSGGPQQMNPNNMMPGNGGDFLNGGNNPHNNPNSNNGLENPMHPADVRFFEQQQQTKENYSSVVDDEELLNIPNDLDYRLDYVLRESQFSGSGYIAALTSHTSYWTSPDAAYFVMTHLYDDLIEQAQQTITGTDDR